MSIDTLNQDNTLAVDENYVNWACVIAGNKYGLPIKGWVNIEKDAQEHIKRVTPWHWSGFNTIEEKATVGELSSKTGKNKVVSLDLEDYTPVMSALHRILTQSTLYSTQRKKPLPPFTYEYLKEGLRRSWTAEQIGHLLLKYESEWYADEALSKWNEIDELFEEEKQQQKDIIEKLLTEHNITKPNEREYAFEKLDEAHENVKSNWQIEKEQRIKPSLWWKKVAEAQVTNNNQTTNANTPNNSNTPKLTNLSSNGKAWFIHPVAMMGYFNVLSIVTYHIYHDGKIEKHFPKKITSGYEQKYKYVYHDKNDNEHEICICEWHTIKKKLFVNNPTGRYTYPNHGTVQENKTVVNDGYIKSRAKYTNGDIHEWIKTESGVSIYQRLTMTNGDIAEYGYHSKTLGNVWKLYQQQEEEAQLIRIPDSVNYVNDDVIIKYELQETFRKYTNPDVMAGFIGALAEIKENIIVTGSAYEQGSCFPSSLHINGEAIDTLYFSKSTDSKKRQKDKDFINALYKFHFQNFRIGSSYKKIFEKMPGYINGKELHDSHLHTENFEHNSIIEVS